MKIRDGIELWLLKKDEKGSWRTLLLRRHAGIFEPFWQPVTGGIERGETPEKAALREAEEEAGLTQLVDNQLVTLQTRQEIKLEKLDVLWRATVFYAVLETDFEVVLSEEHDAFGWFELETEAAEKLRWPANFENLELLKKALKKTHATITTTQRLDYQ